MAPLIFLNAQKPSSLYLNGTRLDEWMCANESGRSVATSASLSTAYNPTYDSALFGGKGGITFNGAQYLESPAAFPELNWTRGFTILIAGTYKSGFFAAADATAIICGAGLGKRLGVGTYCNSWQGLPLTPCVFGLVWDGIDKAGFILNGQVFPVTQGTFSPGSGAFGKLQIGGIIGAGSSMAMDVAGIKIWHEPLMDGERGAYGIRLECSTMMEEFNIPDSIKPNYNIVVDGNSLAVGYFGYDSNTMWDGVAGITGTTPLDLINVASSGLETPSMIDRAATTTDIHLNLSVPHKRRVLIVLELTNDLANTLQTDVGAYNNMKNYCLARKAAGWKVILCTCLPRTQSGINSNFESYRLSLNTMINTNAITDGMCDVVCDIASDATMGITGASNNITFYLDKIHPTAAGHALLAPYITASLTSIL